MFEDLDTPSKIFSAFIFALTGALGVLWKEFRSSVAKCDEKHSESNKQIISLTDSVARVQGEMKGYSEASSRMETMHQEVLEAVKKGRGD